MGCTRSLSKIWVECVPFATVIFCLGFAPSAWAIFASQFSLSAGEQYHDNIFFSKSKEHDFITTFTPTLSLLYAPGGQVVPTGTLNISSSGQLYAHHSELNNFGDNISVNGGYNFQYSPRVGFNLSDTFSRLGPTRTGGLSGDFQTAPTSPPPPGGIAPPPLSQNLKDLISSGELLTNSVSLQGFYLYRPEISFAGGYSNTFTSFISAGGTDVFHTINVRGIYNWRRDHNLHAGYSISISNARNGDSAVIHNFDFGDDYFSNYNLQLTPTLSLAASSGLSFNTGGGGP